MDRKILGLEQEQINHSQSRINRRFLTNRGGRRRLLSIGVSALLSISTFLTAIPLTETIVYADQSNKTSISGLCTGAIANPTVGAGGWSYVYYGKYGGNSVKYRVLSKSTSDFGGSTMLLDCDSTIVKKRFDDNSNNWSDSEICTWLNGETAVHFYCDSFTAQEKAAIVTSTKDNKSSSDGDGRDNLDYQPLTNEKVFFLDAKEATNTSYGYAATYSGDGTREKSGTDTWWWLRSPGHNSHIDAGIVNTSGVLDLINADYATYGVSPAFNINLSSVIFSSVISGKEYKLTVKDDKLGITAGAIERNGTTITVPYEITGDNKDEATQVSVLIMDSAYSAGVVKTSGYTYKKLTVTTWGTNSKGTFTLPAAYADQTCGADYYAYILAEDVNAGNATDYACTPVAINIPDAPGPGPGPAPKPKKDKDDDDDEEEDTITPAKPVNPDAIFAVFYVNGQTYKPAKIGKQKQGPCGQYAFNAGRPTGWMEAFTFNMTVNDKADYTNKKGLLSLYIPKEYQKAGRIFAITALDQNSRIHIYNDIYNNPETVTANIDIDGYAFDLIYKD